MDSEKFDRLELGQSQFELIEFALIRHLKDGSVVNGRYGVNVAKVREVVRMPKINKLSSRIDGVAGVFELRGVPIPAINLAMVLGDEKAPIDDTQQIIVTEFSRKRAGFIVSSTQRIRRVAWDKVLPPTADSGTCINGMAFVENNEFLFILDLEKILIEIENKSRDFFGGAITPLGRNQTNLEGLNTSFVPSRSNQNKGLDHVPGSRGKLLLVDDSNLILSTCQRALESLGFSITLAKDGQLAREFLERAALEDSSKPPVDVIVTDVEMPRMDGLTLTKWIREASAFSGMPVILHTSLSGRSNQQAGISVGANGYVIKNDIKALAELLTEIIGNDEVAS